jgi:hypothetical protein
MSTPPISPLLRGLHPVDVALRNNDIPALQLSLTHTSATELMGLPFLYSSIFESACHPPKDLRALSRITAALREKGIHLYWDKIFECYARSVNSEPGKALIEDLFLNNCTESGLYEVRSGEAKNGLRRVVGSVCKKIIPPAGPFQEPPSLYNKANFLRLLDALNRSLASRIITEESWINHKVALLCPATSHRLISSEDFETDYARSLALSRYEPSASVSTTGAGAASGDTSTSRPRAFSEIDLGPPKSVKEPELSEKIIALYITPQLRAAALAESEEMLSYRLREAYGKSLELRDPALRKERELRDWASLPSVMAYEVAVAREPLTTATFGMGIAPEPLTAPALGTASSFGSVFVSSPSTSPIPDGEDLDATAPAMVSAVPGALAAATVITATHVAPFSPLQMPRGIPR